MAKFIVIEGIDGAGKQTLTTRLQQEAMQQGFSVAVMSFPRYHESIFADIAHKNLYDARSEIAQDPVAMAIMFATDRWYAQEILRENIETNDLVIVDRYIASNIAYTAARQNVDSLQQVSWLASLELDDYALVRPDMQLLLSTPVPVATRQAYGREQNDTRRIRDYYESDQELQERVLYWYHELADQQWISPWIITHIHVEVVQLIHALEL